MKHQPQLQIVGLLLAAAVTTPAHALLESCTVTALPVVFGSYSPLSVSATDSTGNINVTCTAVLSIAVGYTISLSAGVSGAYAPRQMAAGAARLNYNLYTGSARSTIWGDGGSGTATVSDSYALGLLLVSRDYPVYGRIPAQQNVPAGAYADTITVTVTY